MFNNTGIEKDKAYKVAIEFYKNNECEHANIIYSYKTIDKILLVKIPEEIAVWVFRKLKPTIRDVLKNE